MELLLTVLMLAPIGILMWDDKDTSKCKSSSAKKCLLHIGFIVVLPLAVLILKSRRGYLLDIPDDIISLLEGHAMYQIVFIVMAIIIKFGIQNHCNNCSEKDKASISDETGNNKFIIMLGTVLAVLALIGYGIMSNMAK